MPSSHSAFVIALAVSVGMNSGFGSDLFAIAFVLATIIIYDTIRLRGAVQNHSSILKKLMKLMPEAERVPVPDKIGHTAAETVAGLLSGGILAFAANLLV
jgi:acid phosphatase family membrane protein YuiD